MKTFPKGEESYLLKLPRLIISTASAPAVANAVRLRLSAR